MIPAPANLEPGAPLGDEGYRLTIRDGQATIEADTDAGRFYAEQTLERLGTERDAEIADRPRYAWRGFMLDVSRHFFGVDDVKRVIDHLAAYKLNRLHLHLSDDQGWRLVIDSWPRLAEHGGQTAVGGGSGGFFTKDDYAAIVDYAAERHIVVVPEIDMPGHTQAAIASYPELAPEGASHELYTQTGVGSSSLDCHSATTYRWVEDVLGEIAEMTPGPYLHIGGDEAHSTSREDYLAFMERVRPIVAGLGKRLVGWEEIATAPLDDNAIVQYWRTGPSESVELIQEGAAAGAQVILSPGKHVYLDQKYDEDTELGLTWAGYVELRDSYEWEPSEVIPGVEDVLGVEACLWSETITNREELETMLLPRLAAVAEVAWSPPEARDWEDFRGRVAEESRRWETFHRSPQVDWP